MNQPIQWRRLGDSGWNDGTLVDGLNGHLAIKVNGGFVTMDRNGSTRVSGHMDGWEGNFVLDEALPILRAKPNLVTYVIEIRES